LNRHGSDAGGAQRRPQTDEDQFVWQSLPLGSPPPPLSPTPPEHARSGRRQVLAPLHATATMPPLIYLSMGRSRGLGSYLLRGSRRPGRGGGGGGDGRALTISGQSEPRGRPARRGRDGVCPSCGRTSFISDWCRRHGPR